MAGLSWKLAYLVALSDNASGAFVQFPYWDQLNCLLFPYWEHVNCLLRSYCQYHYHIQFYTKWSKEGASWPKKGILKKKMIKNISKFSTLAINSYPQPIYQFLPPELKTFTSILPKMLERGDELDLKGISKKLKMIKNIF